MRMHKSVPLQKRSLPRIPCCTGCSRGGQPRFSGRTLEPGRMGDLPRAEKGVTLPARPAPDPLSRLWQANQPSISTRAAFRGLISTCGGLYGPRGLPDTLFAAPDRAPKLAAGSPLEPQRVQRPHRNFMPGREFGFEPRRAGLRSDLRQCNFCRALPRD